MSQGTWANRSGHMYESVVETILANTFSFVEPGRYMEAMQSKGIGPLYTKQIDLPDSFSIYGDQLTHDFVTYHPEKEPHDLIFEAKWQQSTGSVYEKFPYLVANINRHPFKTIIVLDGKGYKPGAERWLREQVQRVDNLYAVMDTVEFIAWANRKWR